MNNDFILNTLIILTIDFDFFYLFFKQHFFPHKLNLILYLQTLVIVIETKNLVFMIIVHNYIIRHLDLDL